MNKIQLKIIGYTFLSLGLAMVLIWLLGSYLLWDLGWMADMGVLEVENRVSIGFVILVFWLFLMFAFMATDKDFK